MAVIVISLPADIQSHIEEHADLIRLEAPEPLAVIESPLEFETPDDGERGTIILQKHNASGLPEHDDALEVPVRFN